MNSSNPFEVFVERAQSEEAVHKLWTRLVEEQIIGLDGNLGSGNPKTKLGNAISKSNRKADIGRVYSAVAVELSDIYKDKKKNVNRIFTICLIAISIGVLLLLTGLSISFLQQNSKQISMITTASGIITTFLSGTFFWFYKKENIKLAAIENDIKKIKVLEGFAGIASNIQNEEILNSAYQKIITQMDL